MLEHLAEDITFILVKNKIIDIDDRTIYIYGVQIILSTLIITIFLLILGIILDKVILTLFFISTFIILRSYTGGYHAESFSGCFVITTLIYLSELLINCLLLDKYKTVLGMIFVIVSLVVIYRLSPVEHENNPLSLDEKKKFKKISRITISVIAVFISIGFYTNYISIDITFIVSLTILAISILTIIPVLKGGKESYG